MYIGSQRKVDAVASRPVLCYTDVGGTFTDSFVVDENGDFVIGKAPSTPNDIAEGFTASLDAARERLGLDVSEFYSALEVIGYGGTTVLNSILTRRGGRPGLLITKGFEDLLLMERGKQTWVELPRADRIHPVTHRHQKPLVPRELVRGITQRTNSLGKKIIPLYEHDVRKAVGELINREVDSIVVVFLWSFLDARDEKRTREIILEMAAERFLDMPVFLSSEISPTIRELPRANAATVEAFAGPSTIRALTTLEGQLQSKGFRGHLQVMQSAGGLAPAQHVRAIDTSMSGPVGGVVGANFIGDLYGFKNVISTDVGGTSFDVGIITDNFIAVDREPVLGGLLLSLPMMEVVSVGAGGGTLALIDPLTQRLTVGPESAGADPGPVAYGRGGRIPTVTDADLVLGYINPGDFIGGKIRLDRDAARSAIQQAIAVPLGLSVEEAAEGIKRVIDARMRETVVGLVNMRGFALEDYVLLGFGGAGATHVCGYTENLPLKAVLTFPYAAVFSAFGAAAADYEHHYHRAVNVVAPPNADDEELALLGKKISAGWVHLEEQAMDQMRKEGVDPQQVKLRHLSMIRYGRQLNDLIVLSPVSRCDNAQQVRQLFNAFEDQYARVYAKGAQFPQAGFEVFEIGLVATVNKIKPRLIPRPMGPSDPTSAQIDIRPAYFGGRWMDAPRFAWNRLDPGHKIPGPAVIEDPTTTFVVPPGREVQIDEYRTAWISE
jgi:acetone carboxylase beta subunit